MKILKYGTVEIAEEGVSIQHFNIDMEGAFPVEAQKFILTWAIKSLTEELSKLREQN